jgi:hypothetical protein
MANEMKEEFYAIDQGFFELVYQNAELGKQAYEGYLSLIEQQKSYMLRAFLQSKVANEAEVAEFVDYYQSQLELAAARLAKLADSDANTDIGEKSEVVFAKTVEQCFELYPQFREHMQSPDLIKVLSAVEKTVAENVVNDARSSLAPEIQVKLEQYISMQNNQLAELQGLIEQEFAQAGSMVAPVQTEVQGQAIVPQQSVLQQQQSIAQDSAVMQEIPVATPAPAPAPVSTPMAPLPTAPIQTEPMQTEPMPAPVPAPAPIPMAPVSTEPMSAPVPAAMQTAAVPVATIPATPTQAAQVGPQEVAPASNQLPPLPVEAPAAQQPTIAAATREMYRPVNVYPAV